jgi:hypothetical protein
MTKPKFAICDKDELYCMRLDEYLRGNLSLPFEICSFTDPLIMEKFVKENVVTLLMISESVLMDLEENLRKLICRNVLILDEGMGSLSMVREDDKEQDVNIAVVNKYQAASGIVDRIVSYCADSTEVFDGLGMRMDGGKGKVLGLYSPLGNCGQTTMAIAMAEYLAEKAKVAFLSLESFSSLSHTLGISSEEDITDLLYYAECEKEKFGLYLERIKKTRNNVDYVMPAKTAMQIKEINLVRMNNLLELLIKNCGYDYVIVDMTEYPSDFFEIATGCDKIFTITRQHPADKYKMMVYENALMMSGYEELLNNTVKCQMPDVKDKRSFDLYLRDLLEREGIIDGAKT